MKNTNSRKPIGLLGGTFDPVHNGHLRLAIELYERLDLAEVRLIPAARPPLRESPAATAELRCQMVQAAVADTVGLTVDTRELKRPGPSYMIDTLRSFRSEYPENSLCLILGMDAFMGLPQWHQWEQLIELAHLLIVRRPGKLLPMAHQMRDFLMTHQTTQSEDLFKKIQGVIWVEEIPALTISATQIRALLAAHRNPRYLLPKAVLELIEIHQLYR